MKALVFGGTRYFGLRLVRNLLAEDIEVIVATTGTTADPFRGDVDRLFGDRRDPAFLASCASHSDWDVVYDQIGFSPNDASRLSNAFEGRAGRVIFTSSSSVYRGGAALNEAAFDPWSVPVQMGEEEDFSYPEGKRLTEAVYFQESNLPLVAVRFPIVLGQDDYTGRLEFHIDRIRDGTPFHVPNPDAKMSFIDSEDAAKFLCWLTNGDLGGPVNACSPAPIRIGSLVSLAEEKVGRKAILTAVRTAENSSPFGIDSDFFLNTEKAESSGYRFTPLSQWLPSLVSELARIQ